MKRTWHHRFKRLLIRAATALAMSSPALANDVLATSSGYQWTVDTHLKEQLTGMVFVLGPKTIRSEDLPGYCATRNTKTLSFTPVIRRDVELLEALEGREVIEPLQKRQFWVLYQPDAVAIYDGTTGKVAPQKNLKIDEISALCVSYSASPVFRAFLPNPEE